MLGDRLPFGKPAPGRQKRTSCRRERTEWGWRYNDGREVCDLETAEGKREYRRRVEAMWLRQDKRCSLVDHFIALADATFEHGRPRGMGAGFRDDRIDVRDGHGMFVNSAACALHNGEKGSKRLP